MQKIWVYLLTTSSIQRSCNFPTEKVFCCFETPLFESWITQPRSSFKVSRITCTVPLQLWLLCVWFLSQRLLQKTNSKGSKLLLQIHFWSIEVFPQHISKNKQTWLAENGEQGKGVLYLVHKVLDTGWPIYLRLLLNFRGSLRHVTSLHIPRHFTSGFKKSFHYNAVIEYNKIPSSLRTLSSYRFKLAIKRLFLSSQ